MKCYNKRATIYIYVGQRNKFRRVHILGVSFVYIYKTVMVWIGSTGPSRRAYGTRDAIKVQKGS